MTAIALGPDREGDRLTGFDMTARANHNRPDCGVDSDATFVDDAGASLENVRLADEAGNEARRGPLDRVRPGAPSCTMRPSRISATVSARPIASSWSCVTTTNVVPSDALDVLEGNLRFGAQLAIERRHRLVEQKDFRLSRESACQSNALSLAA